MSFTWMVDRLHERLEATGWEGIRPAFGFHLLALRDAPLTATGLAGRLGVSKQAASKTAEAMVDQGLLEREPDATDGRRLLLAISTTGRALLADVEAIYADLESEWAAIIGGTALAETKQRLRKVMETVHDGVLPPVRPPA
jgi:DNA-binding MarR family transcriptional regulator